MKLKIADVSEFYAPQGGGVKTYVNQKFEAAAKFGHDLSVIAPGPDHKTEPREGGRIVWVPAPKLIVDPRYHLFTRGKFIRQALEQIQPDIVEASSPWRGGWVASRWQSRAPKILFMHADPVASYPHFWLEGIVAPATIDAMFGWFWSYLRRLSNPCAATIVSGDWLATRFKQHGLVNPVSFPLGIQEGIFDPAHARADLRAEMLRACGLPETASLLLSVGRFHPEKRLPMLMKAVDIANETRPVGLYIIGDGLSRKSVGKAASLSPTVYLAGQITDRADVAARLASADALIHGAASETFGYVVAESLRAGTPVIVPDRGGAADLSYPAYAEQYETGKMTSAAEAIVRMLARDRQTTRNAAAAAGQTRVTSASEHFHRLFEYYARLVAESKSQ